MMLEWFHRVRGEPRGNGTTSGVAASARSSERYRRIAWSATTAAGARSIGIAASLVTIPLAMAYLGDERFGMWLTLTSIIAVFGPMDLGVANGLRQVVAEADGLGDHRRSLVAISTATPVLIGLGLVLVVALGLCYGWLPWGDIANVSSPQAIGDAGPAAAVIVVVLALGLPLSVVAVVQSAYQQAYITNLWSMAGSALTLGLVVAAIALRLDLPYLVAALAGAGIVTSLLNSVVYFRRTRPDIAPQLRRYSRPVARTLVATGILFAVLQLAAQVGYQLDNVVIAQILGAEAVPGYAVPMRLSFLAPLVVSFALTPLWPAYREAFTRGDHEWILKTLRRSIILTLAVTVPAAIVLFVFGEQVLLLWVGPSIRPTPLLLASLGIWATVYSVSVALAMLLNALGSIRFQIRYAVLMAVANLVLSIILVQQIGIAGAAIGSIVAQVAFILVPFVRHVPTLLATMTSPVEER